MVAFGRPSAEVPEVMVLVVVEDARSKLKFGADVAGPTTMAILRAAHGLEARPATSEELRSQAQGLVQAPAAVEADADRFNARDFPWADSPWGPGTGGDTR
jgi:hypothetical protein